MVLTKSDLSAIRQVVKGETDPIKSDLMIVKKDVKGLNKKFTRLFNFLDKEWSKLKRRADYFDEHLGIDTKEF